MIKLFSPTSTDFDGIGYGIVNDAISCAVTSSEDGTFELNMEYPSNGLKIKYIKTRNLIVAKANKYMKPQAFRIDSISRSLSGNLAVHAFHISYDILSIPIEPINATDYKNAIELIQNGIDSFKLNDATQLNKFKIHDKVVVKVYSDEDTDVTKKQVDFNKSFITEEPTNLRSLLNGGSSSLSSEYKVQFIYDNFDIYVVDGFTRDRSKVLIQKDDYYPFENTNKELPPIEIKYGKNILSYDQTLSSSAQYTGIYAYYKATESSTGSGSKKNTYLDAYICADLIEFVNGKYKVKSDKLETVWRKAGWLGTYSKEATEAFIKSNPGVNSSIKLAKEPFDSASMSDDASCQIKTNINIENPNPDLYNDKYFNVYNNIYVWNMHPAKGIIIKQEKWFSTPTLKGSKNIAYEVTGINDSSAIEDGAKTYLYYKLIKYKTITVDGVEQIQLDDTNNKIVEARYEDSNALEKIKNIENLTIVDLDNQCYTLNWQPAGNYAINKDMYTCNTDTGIFGNQIVTIIANYTKPVNTTSDDEDYSEDVSSNVEIIKMEDNAKKDDGSVPDKLSEVKPGQVWKGIYWINPASDFQNIMIAEANSLFESNSVNSSNKSYMKVWIVEKYTDENGVEQIPEPYTSKWLTTEEGGNPMDPSLGSTIVGESAPMQIQTPGKYKDHIVTWKTEEIIANSKYKDYWDGNSNKNAPSPTVIGSTSSGSNNPTSADIIEKIKNYIALKGLAYEKKITKCSFIDYDVSTDKFADTNLSTLMLMDKIKVKNKLFDTNMTGTEVRIIGLNYDVLQDRYTTISVDSTVEKVTDDAVMKGDGVSSLSNDSGYTDELKVSQIIAKTITADKIEALNIKTNAANITGKISANSINIEDVIEAGSASIKTLVTETLSASNAKFSGSIAVGAKSIGFAYNANLFNPDPTVDYTIYDSQTNPKEVYYDQKLHEYGILPGSTNISLDYDKQTESLTINSDSVGSDYNLIYYKIAKNNQSEDIRGNTYTISCHEIIIPMNSSAKPIIGIVYGSNGIYGTQTVNALYYENTVNQLEDDGYHIKNFKYTITIPTALNTDDNIYLVFGTGIKKDLDYIGGTGSIKFIKPKIELGSVKTSWTKFKVPNMQYNTTLDSNGNLLMSSGNIKLGYDPSIKDYTLSIGDDGTLIMNKGAINLGKQSDGSYNFSVNDRGQIAIQNGYISLGDGTFRVTSDGKVTMTQGSISLGSDYNSTIYMDDTGLFRIGDYFEVSKGINGANLKIGGTRIDISGNIKVSKSAQLIASTSVFDNVTVSSLSSSNDNGDYYTKIYDGALITNSVFFDSSKQTGITTTKGSSRTVDVNTTLEYDSYYIWRGSSGAVGMSQDSSAILYVTIDGDSISYNEIEPTFNIIIHITLKNYSSNDKAKMAVYNAIKSFIKYSDIEYNLKINVGEISTNIVKFNILSYDYNSVKRYFDNYVSEDYNDIFKAYLSNEDATYNISDWIFKDFFTITVSKSYGDTITIPAINKSDTNLKISANLVPAEYKKYNIGSPEYPYDNIYQFAAIFKGLSSGFRGANMFQVFTIEDPTVAIDGHKPVIFRIEPKLGLYFHFNAKLPWIGSTGNYHRYKYNKPSGISFIEAPIMQIDGYSFDKIQGLQHFKESAQIILQDTKYNSISANIIALISFDD